MIHRTGLWRVGVGRADRPLAHTSFLVLAAILSIAACVTGESPAPTVEPTRTIEAAGTRIRATAFSPDGSLLAAADDAGTLLLYDTISWTATQVPASELGSVSSLAFSPDGSLLAVGSYFTPLRAGVVSCMSLAQARALWMRPVHTRQVENVVFSPDGRFIVSCSQDGTARLWEARSGSAVLVLDRSPYTFNAAAFSPDGSSLATAVWRSVVLWDTSTGEEVGALGDHDGVVLTAVYSPDGRLLASGGRDNIVTVWDMSSGARTLALEGHTSAVNFVRFSPDGRLLASASQDATVIIWEASTGRPIHVLRAHVGAVSSVSFSPDGNWIATSSSDRRISLWALDRMDMRNHAPVARFTWTRSQQDSSLLHASRVLWLFDASSSYDPDGEIVEYAWDWNSDGEFSIVTHLPLAGHRFAETGSHRVTLRVTDAWGATGDVSQVVVLEGRRLPEAAFSWTPIDPNLGESVGFVDESQAGQGSLQDWSWDFGDGNTSRDRAPFHAYTQKGTYTVRLTVTTDDGLTATTTRHVTVKNLPPQAAFSFNQDLEVGDRSLVILGVVITFDASQSRDPDGEIVDYSWNLGDGTTAQGHLVTHVYTQEGTYRVHLTITDDDGSTGTSEHEIRVVPGGGGGPG